MTEKNPAVNSHPRPALRSLDRLVGTWNVSGPGHSGQVVYRWLEGGHFLVQHVQPVQDGQRSHGVEYIGYDAESDSLRSHCFGRSNATIRRRPCALIWRPLVTLRRRQRAAGRPDMAMSARAG